MELVYRFVQNDTLSSFRSLEPDFCPFSASPVFICASRSLRLGLFSAPFLNCSFPFRRYWTAHRLRCQWTRRRGDEERVDRRCSRNLHLGDRFRSRRIWSYASLPLLHSSHRWSVSRQSRRPASSHSSKRVADLPFPFALSTFPVWMTFTSPQPFVEIYALAFGKGGCVFMVSSGSGSPDESERRSDLSLKSSSISLAQTVLAVLGLIANSSIAIVASSRLVRLSRLSPSQNFTDDASICSLRSSPSPEMEFSLDQRGLDESLPMDVPRTP